MNADKNLTDNEIIKALECCKEEEVICFECPYKKENGCMEKLSDDALALINRLQAEIKFAENINHLQMEELQSLKDKNKVLANELANSLQDCENKQAENEKLRKSWKADVVSAIISGAKAEAYKEFAERLKEEFPKMLNRSESAFSYLVDNLLKEMVGEDNAEAKKVE